MNGETDERDSKIPKEEASESIRKAGTVAYQSLLAALVLGVLAIVTLGFGFLVLEDAMSAGPFLLLAGILVGFSLGRLDVML